MKNIFHMTLKALALGILVVPLTFYFSGPSTSYAGDGDFVSSSMINLPVMEKKKTAEEVEKPALAPVDGPYLFQKGRKYYHKVQVYDDGSDQYILEEKEIDDNAVLTCIVDNKDQDQFRFRLMSNIKEPPAEYPMPERLLVISDIEGNFNAFHSLLTATGVMNENMEWTFGDGHLVLNGDFMDRGKNVTAVLWLIYKLEQEAAIAGGRVHFILGNHEALNLQGQTVYVHDKYLKVARQLSGEAEKEKAYNYLMSEKSELTKWLLSKNIMEKIGDILFVHGGVSPELVESRLTIDLVNRIGKRHIRQRYYDAAIDDRDAILIASSLGPLWYRGLITSQPNGYDKASESDVDKALKAFKVNHIAVGHTVVSDISTDFNGKVLRTDIYHPNGKRTGRAKGLLIENDVFYMVNDLGVRKGI